MKYQKLGDDCYTPEKSGLPLKNKKNIKFNYYLSSRINGNLIDLDITSKLFDGDNMYIRKSCYRVKLRSIENCVKKNTVDHMLSLGMDRENIPESLQNNDLQDQKHRWSKKDAFSD